MPYDLAYCRPRKPKGEGKSKSTRQPPKSLIDMADDGEGYAGLAVKMKAMKRATNRSQPKKPTGSRTGKTQKPSAKSAQAAPRQMSHSPSFGSASAASQRTPGAPKRHEVSSRSSPHKRRSGSKLSSAAKRSRTSSEPTQTKSPAPGSSNKASAFYHSPATACPATTRGSADPPVIDLADESDPEPAANPGDDVIMLCTQSQASRDRSPAGQPSVLSPHSRLSPTTHEQQSPVRDLHPSGSEAAIPCCAMECQCRAEGSSDLDAATTGAQENLKNHPGDGFGSHRTSDGKRLPSHWDGATHASIPPSIAPYQQCESTLNVPGTPRTSTGVAAQVSLPFYQYCFHRYGALVAQTSLLKLPFEDPTSTCPLSQSCLTLPAFILSVSR